MRRSETRLRKGDCSSCTASAWRSVPSNTGSPVVLVKSARTMVSLAARAGARWKVEVRPGGQREDRSGDCDSAMPAADCNESADASCWPHAAVWRRASAPHWMPAATAPDPLQLVSRKAADGASSAAGGSGGQVRIALQALQIGAHFGGALIAKLAIFFEGLADDALEFRRNVRIRAARARPAGDSEWLRRSRRRYRRETA